MPQRRTIIGVDFSASQSAGESTWISEGIVEDGTLLIGRGESAEERFGRSDRDDVMDRLVKMVQEAGESVVGFDFPFGLPSEDLAETE